MDAYDYMTNRWYNPYKFMTVLSDDDKVIQDEDRDKPRNPSGTRKGLNVPCYNQTFRPIPIRRK